MQNGHIFMKITILLSICKGLIGNQFLMIEFMLELFDKLKKCKITKNLEKRYKFVIDNFKYIEICGRLWGEGHPWWILLDFAQKWL